ncbi:MAG: AAA family ATPase [Saprospiraceae bacterium]|nr:AAA family ATPase [Saprospiraceae bacterium]
MSGKPKIQQYKTLRKLAERLRNDLSDSGFVLLFAYNGTGKTRLSIEFKNKGKNGDQRDTLYFNAFTEDLFSWDNDLENDTERKLRINSESKFFNGFKELALEEKIFAFLERYAEFNFFIDYENWTVTFSKSTETNIKVSRGEENIFIWCVFLAICELTLDGSEAYQWVKYFYIDDPISSLDDNNAIAVATDLSNLLRRANGRIKTVISTHHSLFFNVMCNELKKLKHTRYFLHRSGADGYGLQKTDETPFFHHVAILSELKQVSDSGRINTYHFNMLRSILEKTATFFGYKDFSDCIHGVDDEVLYARALNLLSHGKYSVYEPVEMSRDNKELFNNILKAFLEKYRFELPELLAEKAAASNPS